MELWIDICKECRQSSECPHSSVLLPWLNPLPPPRLMTAGRKDLRCFFHIPPEFCQQFKQQMSVCNLSLSNTNCSQLFTHKDTCSLEDLPSWDNNNGTCQRPDDIIWLLCKTIFRGMGNNHTVHNDTNTVLSNRSCSEGLLNGALLRCVLTRVGFPCLLPWNSHAMQEAVVSRVLEPVQPKHLRSAMRIWP